MNNSKESFSGYKRNVSFMLWVVAILIFVTSIYNSLIQWEIALLKNGSMSVAFALAAYHLRLKSKELDSSSSN
jgi:hypothetical protein